MTAIETERLVLRLPVHDDADGLAPIFADPQVVRWLGGRTSTASDVATAITRWLRHWDEYDVGFYVCDRKDDGRLLGRVGLLVWDPSTWTNGLEGSLSGELETEIGWTIGSEHWGRGYATEAAVAIRDWALGERGLGRLISLIRPENAASIRVAEKLGERLEHEVTVAGYRTLVYALVA